MPGTLRHVMTFVAPLIAAAAARGDVVERRGAEPPLSGQVVIVDEGGVSIRTESGAVHEIAWDRVRAVEADRRDHRLDRLLERAEDLWRARSRIERGDTILAEPLLERIWPEVRGATHETALVVAEGLLRCRLARGARAEAVLPALEAVRLRRAGVTTASYSMLEPVIDERYGLCPHVPPVWSGGRGAQKLPHDVAAWSADDDAVVRALALLYGTAAARATGAALPAAAPPGRDASDHEGVALLEAAVQSMDDDAGQRTSARARLGRRLGAAPPWVQAWSRYFTGRSLLMENDATFRQQGLVELAHLPAEFGRTQRHLAVLALEQLIDELKSEPGNDGAIESLRLELARLKANFAADGEIDFQAEGGGGG